MADDRTPENSDGDDDASWLPGQGPPDDAGAQTQSRFRFQHECTARPCVALLARERVTAAVCEEQEDFVVFFQSDAPELVSVKHREGARGAWTFRALCAEGGVRHLYDRWLETGRRATCRLMTNGALSTGSDRATAFAEACHTRTSQQIQPWVKKLAEELETDDLDSVEAFACVLSIEAGLPGREYIGAVNVRDLVAPAFERLGLDPAGAEAWYRRLLDAIARANRDAVGDPVDLVDVVADPARLDASVSTDRRLARRTIDRAQAATLLFAPATAAPSLAAAGAASSPPPASRLQRKLGKGGLGPTVIDTAIRLRASWYGFESARRTNVPGGDPAFEDLRLRVQELVGLSESRVDRSGSYGPQMHLDVRQTVTVGALVNAPPFPLDDQLLQGLVFQLTDECKVWWSPPFEVEAA